MAPLPSIHPSMASLLGSFWQVVEDQMFVFSVVYWMIKSIMKLFSDISNITKTISAAKLQPHLIWTLKQWTSLSYLFSETFEEGTGHQREQKAKYCFCDSIIFPSIYWESTYKSPVDYKLGSHSSAAQNLEVFG
ncbi:uncharacterized protein LOC120250124 isoform X2 [Dioscorea cayenensis subsp. rotundata]|uniref:Uncharacterized protein LOC120250124 isoform X2 n=1 Tax=Dioscorea cayennensis subsp. rotundata TaxID=55577 RepID=A0AB40AIM6_DIOCR|nr:uncharacterized protein LOC120250124 isoform X2 [Dioscorea cayenensis subsp. rotundata]